MGTTPEGYCARWVCAVRSVAIIGPNGQLGTDLVRVFRDAEWNVIPVLHTALSVEDFESVDSFFSAIKVDWIINTAAFHKVDECEKNPERAWEINATGQANVARTARRMGARTVFISSDYVFSGNLALGQSYNEDSKVSPVNAYGHSKAAGELATMAIDEKNLVVRISSVFGSAGSSGKGGNFIETIVAKAKSDDSLNVVDDIQMSPTYTLDTAYLIRCAIENKLNGILHGNNSGSVSWYEFARTILELLHLEADLTPSNTDWQLPLKRPKNSTMRTSDLTSLNFTSSDWQDGLLRYLKEKGHI
jgi:dTDP-4-dehydrorhamnose reductase